MFQTEPNLLLQAAASDGMTFFMRLISATGYQSFLLVIVCLVMFGVDFRKGFLLIQLLLVTTLAYAALKLAFALPRPFFVDARLLVFPGGEAFSGAWAERGATGFFAPLGEDVVAAYRALPPRSFGLPSGHVAVATALWGGLALLFRHRLLIWWAPVAVVLMALSRMYLAVHFLADVLAGAVLGVVVLFLFHRLYRHRDSWEWLFLAATYRLPRIPAVLLLTGMFALPLLLLLGGLAGWKITGLYWGVNAALLMLARAGLPPDGGSFITRACRVVLAVGLLVGLNSLVALLGRDFVITGVLAGFVPGFVMVWATPRLARRFGLYNNAVS